MSLKEHLGKHLSPEEIRKLEIAVLSDVYGIYINKLVGIKDIKSGEMMLCRVVDEVDRSFRFKALMPDGKLAVLRAVNMDDDDFLGVIVEH